MPKISDAARAQRTFNATVTAAKTIRKASLASLAAMRDTMKTLGNSEDFSEAADKAYLTCLAMVDSVYSEAVSAAALAMVDAGE